MASPEEELRSKIDQIANETEPEANTAVRLGAALHGIMDWVKQTFGVLNISYTKTNVSTYGGSNGSIKVTGSGASAYQFSLNGGAWSAVTTGTHTFLNLTAGNKTIIMRDANDMTKTTQVVVSITQPAAPVEPTTPVVPTFNRTLTTTQYTDGVEFTGMDGVQFKFNAPATGSGTLPVTSLLYAGTTQIGQVVHDSGYAGQQFAVVYNGTTYYKNFASQDGNINIQA